MYGLDGRRRLPETELAWLAGYEGSKPVRTGNAASDQLQLDVSYDGPGLDASLLLIPRVGFLPGDDPRVVATVEAIERELTQDGFVLRYQTSSADDGLPGGEGVFLACSFWLVDALQAIGQVSRAGALFDRLLQLRNDVGLLSEEWDPVARRQLGNTPQAFSHFPLVVSAVQLDRNRQHRSDHPLTPHPA